MKNNIESIEKNKTTPVEKKKLLRLKLSLFAVFIIVLLTSSYYYFFQFPNTIRKTENGEFIEIPNGATLNEVSNLLIENNIIESPKIFNILGRIYTLYSPIKKGFYSFSTILSWSELFKIITKGHAAHIKIVIPEGLNSFQIIDKLKNSKIQNKKNYNPFQSNSKLLKITNFDEALGIEGFLFPDTYYFPINIKEKDVLLLMIDNFIKKLPIDFFKKAKEHDLTPYQLLILASIIEKESFIPEQQKLISSVFHNRLNRKMRLQADPTVIYGTKKFNRPITKSDLRTPTPYNTYIIKSLPPTPISNPGLSSIEAAMNPTKTNYLYFVAKGSGLSQFSENLRDHNIAVNNYRKLNRN